MQIYSWISTACHCLPHTVNEHRTLPYKVAHQHICKSRRVGVFHLHFGFPLPFCQLACLTAMLLFSFAKEHEIGHIVNPLETYLPYGKADSGSGQSYYFLSSSKGMWQRLHVFHCVGLGWRGGIQTSVTQLREGAQL